MGFVAVPDRIPKGETVTSSIVHDLKVNDFSLIAEQ